MRKPRHCFPHPIAGVLGALLCLPACIEGGLNQNQVGPGNQDDGVDLRTGDIAVDPNGVYFLSRSDDSLLYGDIHDGDAGLLEGIEAPSRVAFGYENDRIYVTAEGPDGDHLIAYDTDHRKTLWTQPIEVRVVHDDDLEPVTLPRLAATEDDRFLVVTDRDESEVLDVDAGETIFSESFTRNVVDVDLDHDGSHVIYTLEHTWDSDIPDTGIVMLDLDDGSSHTITVPNCADELGISTAAPVAFLAPTTCQDDRVSVIDIENAEFVRNLPGFGPVALAPRGDIGIAFLDMDDVDEALFDENETIPSDDVRYHLMFIDAETLSFDTMEIGDELPRFTITPDGEILLVDSDSWFKDGRLRILDIDERELHEVEGPDVRLDHFAITEDGNEVYLLDEGLFRIDVPGHTVSEIQIGFEPVKLNITPDDAHVLLRYEDREIFVFSVQAQAILHGISL